MPWTNQDFVNVNTLLTCIKLIIDNTVNLDETREVLRDDYERAVASFNNIVDSIGS